MAILAECPICHKKQSVKNKKCWNKKTKKGCGTNLDRYKKNNSKKEAKTKVRYWINFRVNGKQRREPVGYSIEEARDADGKRRVQKRENRIFDMIPEAKITFKELAEWYLGLERTKGFARYRQIEISLNRFNNEFGSMIVGNIEFEDLENYQAKLANDGLAPATIDDTLSLVKTMVKKAFDYRKVGADTLRTFNMVKKMLKRNSNARDRVLSQDEYQLILSNLAAHAKPIFATGFHTGMRLGEILSLTWDKVDLKAGLIRLDAEDTKDKERRNIPVSQELQELLASIPRGLYKRHVFLYNGQPVKCIKKALKTACDDADVPYGRKVKNGFTFHDLRHTFNTNMRRAGVHESVIMKITGHSSREMFDRYNTIDTEDGRLAMTKMQGYLQGVDQTVDQNQVSEIQE